MSITFKEFNAALELSDEEFNQIQEGLSDLPGFGWLKNIGTPEKKKQALDKIRAERAKLAALKTAKSKALDAEFAQAKASIENGGSGKKHAGTITKQQHQDSFADHGDADRQERAGKRQVTHGADHLAFRAKNLNMHSA